MKLGRSQLKYDRLKAMLELHLELSRDRSLHIDLDLPSNEIGRQILKTLSFHSSRWTTLRLGASHKDLLKDSDLSSVRNSLSQLRHLNIWFPLGMEEPFPVFQSAPALRELIIRGCVARVHNTLRSLSITIDAYDPELSPLLGCLTLPCLTHLEISASDSQGIFTSEDFSLASEHGFIVSFLSRSQCQLTSLSLKNLPLHDIEVVSLLQDLPSLTVLTLHDHSPDEDIDPAQFKSPFTGLFFQTCTAPASTLLPHLKELDFRYTLSLSFPTSDFLRMVHSRWIPDVAHAAEMGIDSLTSVTVRPLKERDDELGSDLLSLRVLTAAGLRVLILPKLLE
ncbi:hypothetical protein D9758_012727 [Tetrapyrgos nigripes]|uniref:Uncharacterized protein n=1 Tax=Tetrapyrgos nigripes TaxID=182062 RepID=A0A8H5CW85_9AGAR|nr:hypothetical protein D9758_012727 [Tetrapyrgos nigripes]